MTDTELLILKAVAALLYNARYPCEDANDKCGEALNDIRKALKK